jgi:hypothetical protein
MRRKLAVASVIPQYLVSQWVMATGFQAVSGGPASSGVYDDA